MSQSWLLSSTWLGLWRLSAFCLITAINIYVLVDRVGADITVEKRDGTVMKVRHLHLTRFVFFTSWCWCLHGFYFFLATLASFAPQIALISKAIVSGSMSTFADPLSTMTLDQISSFPLVTLSFFDQFESFTLTPQHLARIAWISLELSFACAFLVSCVVTYALIPMAIKRGSAPEFFFRFLALAMHNLNIIFMALELWLTRLPFVQVHVVFACLFGVLYVVFSQFWYLYAGHYNYFFLYPHKRYSTLAHALLLVVLCLFFMGGFAASEFLHSHTHIATPLLALITYACLQIDPPKSMTPEQREAAFAVRRSL